MKTSEKKIYKVYLFRHGQTYFNRDGIFTGWLDSKLTPFGIKQARIITEKLKHKKFEIAFYTRLSRSKETLNEVLKYHPECRKIIIDNRMIERNYGLLNGVSHSAFIKRIGERDINFLQKQGDALGDLEPKKRKELARVLGKAEYDEIHRGYDVRPPKGESFADVEKRVFSFIIYLKELIKKEKTNVAISSHGNSIRLFRKIIEHASKKEACEWFIPYDKVFEYEINV